MFTAYKYDDEAIAIKTQELQQSLKAHRGQDDLLAFGLAVVSDRLKADKKRYRNYGPYWPALKAALRSGGFDFGADVDGVIRREYCGADDLATLVKAEQFRDYCLANFFKYTNEFHLDENEPAPWVLFDEDMEQ